MTHTDAIQIVSVIAMVSYTYKLNPAIFEGKYNMLYIWKPAIKKYFQALYWEYIET